MAKRVGGWENFVTCRSERQQQYGGYRLNSHVGIESARAVPLTLFLLAEKESYFPVNVLPLAQVMRNNFGAKRKVVWRRQEH